METRLAHDGKTSGLTLIGLVFWWYQRAILSLLIGTCQHIGVH